MKRKELSVWDKIHSNKEGKNKQDHLLLKFIDKKKLNAREAEYLLALITIEEIIEKSLEDYKRFK